MLALLLSMLLFLLPFQWAVAVPPLGIDIPWFRLAAVLAIACWAVWAVFTPREEWLPAALALPCFSFLVIALGSVLAVPEWRGEWIRKSLFLAGLLPLALVWYAAFRHTLSRRLLRALLLGATASAVFGLGIFLLQWLWGVDRVFRFLTETGLPFFLGERLGGLVASYPSLLVNIGGETWLRVTAAFPDPHVAAFFFGMSACLALGLYQETRRGWWLTAALLLIGADLLTFSRGGYIGLIAGLGIWGAYSLKGRTSARVFIWTVSGLPLAMLLGWPVLSRFFSSFTFHDASSTERFRLWGEALSVWSQHPLFGVGLGQYAEHAYPWLGNSLPYYAHNLYLDIAVELGLVGLLVWLGLLLAPLLAAWKTAWQHGGVALGAVAALFVYLTHSLFETALFSLHVTTLLTAVLALLVWEARHGQKGYNRATILQPSLMHWTWRAVLSSSVFLLFPIAHLRLFSGWPFYLAELPLLMTLGLALAVWPKLGQGARPALPRGALRGGFLFVGGVLLTFLLQELPMRLLGAIKSFVVLPVLFFSVLAAGRLALQEQRVILFGWWLGLAATAGASLMAFGSGYVTYDGRLAGQFSSPNHLAMLLAPGVIIGGYLSLSAHRRLTRFVLSLATFGIIGALFLTRSYGTLAAAVLGGAVFWAGQCGWRAVWKSWAAYAVVLALAIGVVLEVPTDKFQALFQLDERSSLASRSMIWESGWAIAKASFPWGIGIGQFQRVYLEYQRFFPPYLEWAVPEPHQLFLAWYLSAGLLGLAGVLWCLADVLRGLWRTAHAAPSGEAALAWCYLGLIGYWLACGVVDTPYFKSDLALGFWGLLGLAWSLVSSHDGREELQARD